MLHAINLIVIYYCFTLCTYYRWANCTTKQSHMHLHSRSQLLYWIKYLPLSVCIFDFLSLDQLRQFPNNTQHKSITTSHWARILIVAAPLNFKIYYIDWLDTFFLLLLCSAVTDIQNKLFQFEGLSEVEKCFFNVSLQFCSQTVAFFKTQGVKFHPLSHPQRILFSLCPFCDQT